MTSSSAFRTMICSLGGTFHALSLPSVSQFEIVTCNGCNLKNVDFSFSLAHLPWVCFASERTTGTAFRLLSSPRRSEPARSAAKQDEGSALFAGSDYSTAFPPSSLRHCRHRRSRLVFVLRMFSRSGLARARTSCYCTIRSICSRPDFSSKRPLRTLGTKCTRHHHAGCIYSRVFSHDMSGVQHVWHQYPHDAKLPNATEMRARARDTASGFKQRGLSLAIIHVVLCHMSAPLLHWK